MDYNITCFGFIELISALTNMKLMAVNSFYIVNSEEFNFFLYKQQCLIIYIILVKFKLLDNSRTQTKLQAKESRFANRKR